MQRPSHTTPALDDAVETAISPAEGVRGVILFALLLLCGALAGPQMGGLMQALMTRWLGEGSQQTYVGVNGWLFEQGEIDALTGHGPMSVQQVSAIRHATHPQLRSARQATLDFAAQIRERGISLMLVPVPMKVSIYPEHITGARRYARRSAVTYVDGDDLHGEAPFFHPDEGLFYEDLRKAGVDVVDLVPALLQLKEQHDLTYRRQLRAKVPDIVKKEVYLRQDSYWTAETMQQVAKALAKHVRERYPALASPGPQEIINPRTLSHASAGDLVRSLGLPSSQRLYPAEGQTLLSLPEMQPDVESPVVLLGDRAVAVYDDPALNSPAQINNELLRAGFAQHLAFYLGQSLDFIHHTDGRPLASAQILASRPDDEVRRKKLIIWVISGSDLLLSTSQGVQTGKAWEPVSFNSQRNPPQPVVPMLPK